MTADELRALQAPLKALYKDEPARARHTFQARGTLRRDQPSVHLHTRFAQFDAGLHPKAGGDDSQACSGDLLLESLVACAGVTFNVVATAMGIPFEQVDVVVEGDGDFRGTLGISKEVPVGMTDIRLRFEVASSASDEQLATLLRLTERYCVILQTLQHPPRVAAQLERVSANA
jgi:uncharacterized OsmC-like protein